MEPGKKHTEQSKQKIREALKNRKPLSLEARQKISQAHLGEKHWNWKGGVKRKPKTLRRLGVNPTRAYKAAKKDKCEECGFTPKHICQLDIDHVDGNHSNNNLQNLRTLCANCHRLKTYLSKNFLNKVNRKVYEKIEEAFTLF